MQKFIFYVKSENLSRHQVLIKGNTAGNEVQG